MKKSMFDWIKEIDSFNWDNAQSDEEEEDSKRGLRQQAEEDEVRRVEIANDRIG